MSKEIFLPQGIYVVGKDIPSGTYLVTALSTQSSMYIYTKNNQIPTVFNLNEKQSKCCYFEVGDGCILKIEGKNKIKKITNFPYLFK